MATDGFSSANLLGEGGFGQVHKGNLSNGKEVAVKQLKIGSSKSFYLKTWIALVNVVV